MDVEHAAALVDAVHRALVDASAVLHVDAGLADRVRHRDFPLSTVLTVEIQFSCRSAERNLIVRPPKRGPPPAPCRAGMRRARAPPPDSRERGPRRPAGRKRSVRARTYDRPRP